MNSNKPSSQKILNNIPLARTFDLHVNDHCTLVVSRFHTLNSMKWQREDLLWSKNSSSHHWFCLDSWKSGYVFFKGWVNIILIISRYKFLFFNTYLQNVSVYVFKIKSSERYTTESLLWKCSRKDTSHPDKHLGS